MELFATATRNVDGQPHNRDAWMLLVFDGSTRVWGDIIYDHTLVPGVPLEVQLIERLGNGPYAATVQDVNRTNDGYRIVNVHLR